MDRSVFSSDVLEGQVALVTGGATGIGKEICRVLGAHGARVTLVSRKQENLEAAVDELRADGVDAAFGVCDVRDAQAVQAVVESVVGDRGRLDIVINDAAGNFPAPMSKISPNGFKAVVDIDLLGTYNVTRTAFDAWLAEHGGSIVAHGCTGKGNDQVRFEVGFASLAPDLEVLAPVRDYAWTREKAIAFAEENAIPINVTKRSPFSIDQNVWGRAVETGFLEHLWNAPTKDVYDYTEDPTVNWNTPDEVIVGFERGVPVTIDGNSVSVLQAIEELNRRAGAQGVGRLDVVEDRLVGIKSREIYEAPGAMVLITAHTELEHVTLERELGRFKRQTDQRWAELVYDGLWYSPLKTALETFVAKTQEHVTGEIRMVLHGGHIAVNGRRSAESLYDFNLATYDEGDTFDQSMARGFVYVHGLSSKLAARRDLATDET